MLAPTATGRDGTCGRGVKHDRDSGSPKAANYAYLAILLCTGAMLALAYELLRFVGVRWLVTMSPEVVARVIRRRRRILRTTHKLLSDKTSSNAAVEAVSQPLSELSLSTLRPAEVNSSYSRTLLADDANGEGDSQEVAQCGTTATAVCLCPFPTCGRGRMLGVTLSVNVYACFFSGVRGSVC